MKRSNMDRTAACTVSLISCLLLITACQEPPPPVEVLRPVRSQTVTASAGTRTRTFSGIARAGQETQLSFRVPGTIDHLGVRVGESVGAGQLIARLEVEDFEITVQQSRANLAQASTLR